MMDETSIKASDDLFLHVAPANLGTRNVQPFFSLFQEGIRKQGIY